MATASFYAVSSVSGTVSTPANALNAADGVFTADGNSSASWTHVWALDTLAGIPSSTQTITIRVRKGSNSKDPQVTAITLRQGAVTLFDDTVAHTVTSTTFQDIVNTVDGSAFDNSYNNLELTVTVVAQGGSPSVRNSVELDSITFDANYTAPPPELFGDITVTEAGDDTFTADGVLVIVTEGDLSVSESGNDSITGDGQVLIQSTSMALTESSSDTIASEGVVPISGDISVSESGTDTLTASAGVPREGDIAVTESATDTLSMNGVVTSNTVINGYFALVEPTGDTFHSDPLEIEAIAKSLALKLTITI